VTTDDELLDPTDSALVSRRSACRLDRLDGKRVTLLDISKAKGSHLLDRVEELLRERFHPRAIVRLRKPTYARPAPEDLRQEILKNSDAVIEALAD
jgi:hypothetical protein